MTYIQDESSVESSLPEEFWLINHGTIIYRIATGNRDLQVGSSLYTAIASARSSQKVPALNSASDMEISLPVDHPLVVRWLLQGVPPHGVSITIYRRQFVSQEIRQIWSGRLTSLSIEGSTAKWRVPSRSMELMLRTLPNYKSGRGCPHLLYSGPCGIAKAAFQKDKTVLFVDGRLVQFDLGTTGLDNWSKGGYMIHNPSGEKMTIRSQEYLSSTSSVVRIELQMQIPGMQNGDSISVFAGCDHTLETCVNKFDNRANFGGFPQLPRINPFIFRNRLITL